MAKGVVLYIWGYTSGQGDPYYFVSGYDWERFSSQEELKKILRDRNWGDFDNSYWEEDSFKNKQWSGEWGKVVVFDDEEWEELLENWSSLTDYCKALCEGWG